MYFTNFRVVDAMLTITAKNVNILTEKRTTYFFGIKFSFKGFKIFATFGNRTSIK